MRAFGAAAVSGGGGGGGVGGGGGGGGGRISIVFPADIFLRGGLNP